MLSDVMRGVGDGGRYNNRHACVCVRACVRTWGGGRGEGGWVVGGEGLQHTFVQSTYLRSNTRIFVSACRLLSANSLSFLSSSPSSSLILCGVRTQVDSCKSRAKSHGHMTSSRERYKLEVLITGSAYYRKLLLPEVLTTECTYNRKCLLPEVLITRSSYYWQNGTLVWHPGFCSLYLVSRAFILSSLFCKVWLSLVLMLTASSTSSSLREGRRAN